MASDWGSASDINYPPPSAPPDDVQQVWGKDFRLTPLQPAGQKDHDPEALSREDCPACVANDERPLMLIERSNGRQRTCCDSTSAQVHSSLCPHYEVIAQLVQRFVRTYYAAGQVVEVRMPKNLLEPPVVVQRHDQRAEDATYENEFTMNGER